MAIYRALVFSRFRKLVARVRYFATITTEKCERTGLYHARRVISRSTTTSLFEDRTLGDDGLPSWSDTVGEVMQNKE